MKSSSRTILNAEILERICEFPLVTKELTAQEMLTGEAARERDGITLAELDELMRVLVTNRP